MKHLKIFEDIQDALPGIVNGKVNSWVNIKIDNDLALRISRYAKAIDYYSDRYEIEDKLEILSDPSIIDGGIQYNLSVIMLLQYLKEIRTNFNSQTGGYLIEDYISGLLHLPKRVEDYKVVDLWDGRYKYQIKFYSSKTNKEEDKEEKEEKTAGHISGLIEYKGGCDYYIIAIKKDNFIYIWVLSKNTIKNVLTKSGRISISKIDKTYEPVGKIDLSKIDHKIKKITKGIQDKLEKLYESISSLNYNIETIITGVDKYNNIVKDIEDLDLYYDSSEKDIHNIGENLKKVKGIIKGSIKRKFK